MSQNAAAVFLDRDGVLTEPVWNPSTAEYESPHRVADVELCPEVMAPLRTLRDRGFELFIVSNQPSYAKGKVNLGELQAIARVVNERFDAAGVHFRDTYYCFHHPDGVVAGYSGACACRKPEPYFVRQAAEQYGLDLSRSWMIGDRDTDVECGKRAGCRTVLINHRHGRRDQRSSQPDYVVQDLLEAAALIVRDLIRPAVAASHGAE
jgi:D-glycero-D-manno-heptose 1,7-bisphosphate phosphatase